MINDRGMHAADHKARHEFHKGMAKLHRAQGNKPAGVLHDAMAGHHSKMADHFSDQEEEKGENG